MTALWPVALQEDERLAVLDQLALLDTPGEERFDRITRLASRVLAVPIALVTLVDADRQWFKSTIGLDVPEVRREESICAWAIAADLHGLLIVEDASLDPRFAHLPAVSAPDGVRAYAGTVLRVRDRAVGTLSVMDDRVRSFAEDELAALVDLGHWAEAELRAEDERRLTQKLESLQHRTEMVLEGVAEGVVGVDADGRVTFVNSVAAGMLGWPEHELLGVDLHATTHARHADGTPYPHEDCPVSEVLRTGRSQRHLFGSFWRQDGIAVPIDWSAGAVREDDEVVGAVVVFGDASHRLAMEQLKDDFTAVVSHELRTPLTSLKGALGLLENGAGGALPPGAGPLVDIALRNAKRLARLVDDILDVERSSKGGMPLSRRPLNVGELMRTASATVQGTAMTRGIDVAVESVDAVVWGDEHRLLQVLTNLLGNAMRFSPEGSCVSLHAERDDTAVRIGVTDQGVGIPAESLDRVFDRFWQMDGSTRRARGGTGLGLTIAKNIVEGHGGLISVDSQVGVGSTFTVCLPLRSQDRPVTVERRAGTRGSGDARATAVSAGEDG
jgi:PAS domain S-box-containing protein